MGSSGLVSAVILSPKKAMTDPSVAWKALFLATFVVLAYNLHQFTNDERLAEDASMAVVNSFGYIIGGFLVGFGTKLGNGCTTGHGICGLARFSKRSMVAVATFMATGIAAANIMAPDNHSFSKYSAFLRTDTPPELYNQTLGLQFIAPIVLVALTALFNTWRAWSSTKSMYPEEEKVTAPLLQDSSEELLKDLVLTDETEPSTNDESKKSTKSNEPAKKPEKPEAEIEVSKKYSSSRRMPNRRERVMIQDGVGKLMPAVLSATLFAFGLAISGMVQPSKILGFLNFLLISKGTYDPTLLVVMFGGALMSMISYQFVGGVSIFSNSFTLQCPRASSSFAIPKSTTIDIHLVAGAMAFGVGWGIAGLCPGPALFLASSGTQPIIMFWWPAFVAGAFLAKKLKEM